MATNTFPVSILLSSYKPTPATIYQSLKPYTPFDLEIKAFHPQWQECKKVDNFIGSWALIPVFTTKIEKNEKPYHPLPSPAL